jgi:hypothetical protein
VSERLALNLWSCTNCGNRFETEAFVPANDRGGAKAVAKLTGAAADAKGSAEIKVKAPQMPTRVNAILLVFHSDGHRYGESRGNIGIDMHHQLIAKIP